MRSIYLAAGAATILGLFAACGGDDHAGVIEGGGNTSGKGSTSGSSGKSGGGTDAAAGEGGAGGGDGGPPSDPLAPIIIITSPEAISDPNGEGVLTDSSVAVSCVVTGSKAKGAADVNAATVKVAVLDANGAVIDEHPAIPTDNDNEYSAALSLAQVPAGRVGFTCTAADTAQHVGSAKISSFLDKGPLITFIRPEQPSAQALNEALDIEFTVEAQPLSSKDEHAGVEEVLLDVAGVDIPLDDAEVTDGHYRLQVDLTDPEFNPTPNGATPVTVKASNSRAPTPVRASVSRSTAIDGAGPQVSVVSPGNKVVVGGTVHLVFKVADDVAGVDPDTVVVSLNDEDNTYDPASDRWAKIDATTFSFDFDSRQVKGAQVQITVNIRANDLVGNVSAVSSELLYLDNYPPSIDLDPFNIRTLSRTDGACSVSFDPVGDGAVNDLDSAEFGSRLRAVVWDNTNHTSDIDGHHAGVNPGSVRLYVEADKSKPLLIDKDGDGVCDEVAQVNNSNSIELNSVAPNLQVWYKKGDEAAAPAVAGLGCPLKDGPAQQPDTLCSKKSDMYIALQDNYSTTPQPVIYAVGVSAGDECTGVAWEFTGKTKSEGWTCFVARGVDNVGNVGVSRPLRLCVDTPPEDGEVDITPDCATANEPPPSCTDGCTPPPRWGNLATVIP
jgi:hypothetical protein